MSPRAATVTKLRQPSNKFRFTKDALDKLQPRATRYEVYDTGQPGLELRVTPKGVKTFRRRKFGQAPVTLGVWGDVENGITSVDQARLACQAVGVDYGSGVDVAQERRDKRELVAATNETVLALLERYLDTKQWRGDGLRERTKVDYRADFDLLLGPLLVGPYAALTPAIIKKRHAQASVKANRVRLDGSKVFSGSPFRADRAVHVLAAMAKHLKLGPHLCGLVYEAKAITEVEAAEPRVDDDEAPGIGKWLDKYAAHQHKRGHYKAIVADMYRIALTTGMRPATIARLEVGMIKPVERDPSRHYLDLPGRILKYKKDAVLPLSPRARAVLLERIERLGIANDPTALLFGRANNPRTPMRDNCIIASDIEFDFGKRFSLRDMRKVFNASLADHVRAPDHYRAVLMTRVNSSVEYKHYLKLSTRKRIDGVQHFVDEACAYLYGDIPLPAKFDPNHVAKVRRAIMRKGHK